jgi:hypothetical protein
MQPSLCVQFGPLDHDAQIDVQVHSACQCLCSFSNPGITADSHERGAADEKWFA